MTPLVASRAGAEAQAKEDVELPGKEKLLGIQGQNALTLHTQEGKDNYTRTIAAANINAAARIAAATIAANASRYSADKRASSTSQFTEATIAPYMHRALTGQETVESLAKTVPIKERAAIINGANASGIQLLKDRQVQNLEQLSLLVKSYQKAIEMNDALEAGDTGLYKVRAKESQELMGGIAKTIGQDRGMLSRDDLNRAGNFFPALTEQILPNIPIIGHYLGDKNANKYRVQQFKNMVDEFSNKAIPLDTTPVQRKALAAQFNLLDPSGGEVVTDPNTGKKYNVAPPDANGHRAVLGEVK